GSCCASGHTCPNAIPHSRPGGKHATCASQEYTVSAPQVRPNRAKRAGRAGRNAGTETTFPHTAGRSIASRPCAPSWAFATVSSSWSELVMSAFSGLVIAAIVWIALHLGVSGTSLRARLVGAIGAGPLRGLFSLASLLVVAWLATSYGEAGAVRGLWATPHWLLVACMLLMLPALILFVGSVSTPNPTLIAGPRARDGGDPARGVLRVTRHPMLWSFAIWALVHLILFGT